MSSKRPQGSPSNWKPSPQSPSKSNPFKNENDSPLTPPPHTYKAVPIIDRGHGHTTSKVLANMDPFEVRVRFTQQLASLSASVTSSNKTAQYALKYRDLDEDLHSCILEQLERVSPLLTFIFIVGIGVVGISHKRCEWFLSRLPVLEVLHKSLADLRSNLSTCKSFCAIP